MIINLISTNICLSLQRQKDYAKKEYFSGMILVTGGTGFLGSNLVKRLVYE